MYSRIKNLRVDKDVPQRVIAEYLNCSQTAYSNYELGLRDIPTDILIKLAEFHNTSTDYLLGLTDMIKPYPTSNHEK